MKTKEKFALLVYKSNKKDYHYDTFNHVVNKPLRETNNEMECKMKESMPRIPRKKRAGKKIIPGIGFDQENIGIGSQCHKKGGQLLHPPSRNKLNCKKMYTNFHREENDIILTKLKIPPNKKTYEYKEEVNAALNSKYDLPEAVRKALDGVTLRINHKNEFILKKKSGTSIHHNYSSLKEILQKNHISGWLEWLQGEHGWIIECDKHLYLEKHRELHKAYSIKVRALLSRFKKEDPNIYHSLKVLYYKQDPVTQKSGGRPEDGKRQNTQTLWKKVSENQFLQDAVGNIRPLLEVILHFCTHRKEGWRTLPWLNLTEDMSQERINIVRTYAFELMRNSERGPDAPVQWALHAPINHYPRTVVTPYTMTEVVVGIANILSHLFLPSPVKVMNMEGVENLLNKFQEDQENSVDSLIDDIIGLTMTI